jgi:hypothetical protein
MKAVFKRSLLLVASLAVTGVFAASAQAQSPVSLLAQDPLLGYEGAGVVCDTGTADGTVDSGGNFELELAFSDCDIDGLGAVDVICDGTLSWTPAGVDLWEVDDLNAGFICEIEVPGICTITIEQQDLPIPGGDNDVLLVAEDTYDVTVDWVATRSGSALCGPSQGEGFWSGLYEEVP